MLFGLFGYYPWHFGVVGLLGHRSRDLNLPWDLVTSIVILSGVLGVYPKTLGCLFSLCAGYSDYALWPVIANSSVYSCYSVHFLWRLNAFEAWYY